MREDEDRRLHHEVSFVGLRAQATAVGFLQLCIELRRAGVLEEEAIGRIKDKIVGELALNVPRSATRESYTRDLRVRLDRLFKGQEPVGSAGALGFPEEAGASAH